MTPKEQEKLLKHFNRARSAHKTKLEEIKYLRQLYENKIENARDWLAQYENLDEEEKKKLFRSGLVSMFVGLIGSIITDGRARFYCNPVFNEEIDEDILRQLQAEILPPWVGAEIEKWGNPREWLNSVVDDIVDEFWVRSTARTVGDLTMKDGVVAGKSWVKLRLEDENIRMEHLRFENVCEDPRAVTKHGRRHIFCMKPMSLSEVEEEYGIPVDTLKADGSLIRDDVFGLMDRERDSNSTFAGGERGSGSDPDTSFVLLVEAYVKDNSMEDGLKRYPTGRIITFIPGQGGETDDEKMILISDESNAYPLFPIFDYIPVVESEVEGRPMVRDIACFQEICDYTMQQTLLNFEVAGTVRVFCDEEETDKVKNIRRGVQVIPLANARSINFNTPNNSTSEGISLFTSLRQIARDSVGMHEAAEGKKTGRVESGKAYITMNEFVSRRLRPAAREWERFLTDLMTVWCSMMVKIYTKGKVVRSGVGFRTARVLPFSLDAYITDFDVFVGEDSSLPKDKQTLANMMLELAKLPAEDGRPYVDRRTVLEALEIENIEQIIKRLDLGTAQMQAIQDLQAQLEQSMNVVQQLSGEIQGLQGENAELEKAAKGKELAAQVQVLIQQMKNTHGEYQAAMRTQNQMIDSGTKIEIAKISASAQKSGSRGPQGNPEG